jgi:tetratricopeptide (TPR) repeat protein
MAQNSGEDLQKQVERLKKEKDLLDAQKAKLDAEKALADAQKALDQAKDSSAQQLNELQKAKALADAQKQLVDSQKALQQAQNSSGQKLTELQTQKSLADAQKALANAETQATLARYIGDVKAGQYSGTVTMKDKAGTEEALLLGARAVKQGADKIAKAVKDKADKFYLFGAKEFPNFQRLLTFRFRKELIKKAFETAGITLRREELPVTPGMVSAGLDAFSKILGFFKTDYEIGGIDVKLDESLLIFSVAGRLAPKEVLLPLTYEPSAQAGAVAALTNEMAELVRLRNQTADEVTRTKNLITDFEKKAADPQNAANKDTLLARAAALKPRLDQLNGVIALYDSFASSLTTPEANTGSIPLAILAQEFAIDTALKETKAAVLLLRMDNSGGGYLLKKNLFTGLWAMPLYHMGGATVGYLLLSGPDGKVVAGDVYPIHGGFVRTDKIRCVLEKENP